MNWSKDQEARFHRVYKEVFPIITRVTSRITNSTEAAEEVCHEAFIRYYARLDQIPDEPQAKYWLIRVSKNLALNYIKRKKREKRAYERLLKEPTREVQSGETLVVRKETRKEVQEALEQIPEKYRVILIMKEYGDLSYKEIGEALGLTEGNVKVRAFRGREKLAALLQQGGNYGS
ncbi:MAG: RNA polymerase sigma factor [Spirochaetales bacterium]|nr:RNA polymerase sigma factor [Spirochaetales bacterium]